MSKIWLDTSRFLLRNPTEENFKTEFGLSTTQTHYLWSKIEVRGVTRLYLLLTLHYLRRYPTIRSLAGQTALSANTIQTEIKRVLIVLSSTLPEVYSVK